MSRGKYAERAKTKQAADGATALAIAEASKLRAEIRRLTHLVGENDALRAANADLRRQLDAGESDRLQHLERVERDSHRALAEASRTLEETITYEKAQARKFLKLIRESDLPRSTRSVIVDLFGDVYATRDKGNYGPAERAMRDAGKAPSRGTPKTRADVAFIFTKRLLADEARLRKQWLLIADSRASNGYGLISDGYLEERGEEEPL